MGRPKGSKNKNKKHLIDFLEHNKFDFYEEFKKAYDGAEDDEKLRWFGKILPFAFHRIDNNPQLELNANITVNRIESPQKLLEILRTDPFLDVNKLIEGEVVDVSNKPTCEVPKLCRDSRESGAGNIGSIETDAKERSNNREESDLDGSSIEDRRGEERSGGSSEDVSGDS